MPKKYSKEYKDNAVRVALDSGKPLRNVAKMLGISYWTLRDWKKDYMAENEDFETKEPLTDQEELRRLRREVVELRKDNEILKKYAAILTKERPENSGL